MKKGVFAAFLVLIFSCNNGEAVREEGKELLLLGLEGEGERNEVVERIYADEAASLAKDWLVATIEDFFADYSENGGDFSGFCTDEYIEYKRDAIQVNLEGHLSEEEFKEKWKHKKIEFAGINDAFLIAAQDFSTIKVVKCERKETVGKGSGWFFETVLEDVDYRSRYVREISVKGAGNSFIIDDVAEIENIFPE